MMIFSWRVIFTIILSSLSSVGLALDIKFEKAKFKLVKYGSIPSTTYQFFGKELTATVNSSASGLVYPFPHWRSVQRISFKLKIKGRLDLSSAKVEASKKGDDNYFRIGLMVSGKAPFVPFFAPGWVKLTRDYLKHPSNGMQVYFVNAQHKPGATWFSPYSKSIQIYSVTGVMTGDGYSQFTIKLKQPIKVVGLFLLADGDDTKSSFKVWVKNLKIE